FLRDNSCTVEFDPFGFSVKDFITRRVLLRCVITGDLYPVMKPSTIPHAFLTNQYTWYQRLRHPGSKVLRRLVSSDSISCNKEKLPILCHAYTNHKLGPRATPSIFLGHAANHFGYHCLDLNTNKSIISCHVTFYETVFLFPSTKSTAIHSYDFLDDSTDLISTIIRTAPITPVSAPVHTPQVDVPTPPTPPPPPTPQSVPQIVPKHAPDPTNDSLTVSIHPMVTRSRVGTTRPNPCYAGHVSTISPLPRSYKEAFNEPNWQNAMFNEYNAIIKNKTWTSVPRPDGANIVCCMWLFRHKFFADGTLSQYKARLVSNGSTQVEGVDIDETFSLVVKPGTIWTVLSLAISQHWPIHQLDVKNAFLHGDLAETVYMHQPTDGIVLIASSDRLLQQILASLHREFSMTDLGALNYFLRILVTRDSSDMFLSQCKYAMEILKHAHMYLTSTRPDITYDVQQVCLYLHDPHEPHFFALKRNLRAEAGYRSVANAIDETCWIQNLLCELHTPLSSATIVYCDNVSAVYLSSNPYADIFTKGLPSALFDGFRDSLSVFCTPAPTAGTKEEQRNTRASEHKGRNLANISAAEISDLKTILKDFYQSFEDDVALPVELTKARSHCRSVMYRMPTPSLISSKHAWELEG
nr:ribonuclease H-like domain-containing protein [Tanacetum cinerariifolium]